jgi:hypothetical protein
MSTILERGCAYEMPNPGQSTYSVDNQTRDREKGNEFRKRESQGN